MTRVKFTYPPALLHRPLIYELGKQFGLVTNIGRANISDTHGWVDMELVGAPMAIEAALAWVVGQGLEVRIVHEPDAAHLSGRGVDGASACCSPSSLRGTLLER